MNRSEKKEAWRLIGAAIDRAVEDGETPAAFLTRFALLCALELPELGQVSRLIEVAHEAGRAGRAETTADHTGPGRPDHAGRQRPEPAAKKI